MSIFKADTNALYNFFTRLGEHIYSFWDSWFYLYCLWWM